MSQIGLRAPPKLKLGVVKLFNSSTCIHQTTPRDTLGLPSAHKVKRFVESGLA